MNKADVDRICGSVDLYEALQRPISTWSPYGTGGPRGIENLVNIIDGVIDSEFSSRGKSLSHKDINYFFEFSILPSVLDPLRPGKLACFSYLWGDKVFGDIFTIKPGTQLSLYEQVIADMLKRDKISVFHHPNFLFDIGAGGTDSVTITFVPHKGSRKVLNKNAREKAIVMPRSFSETIQISRDYYSLPPSSFKTLYEVQDALHDNLVSKIADTEDSYFVSFPIIGAASSNQLPQNIVNKTSGIVPVQGIGSFFLYLEGNCITKAIVSGISQKLYVSIGEIGRLYAANYLFNLGLQLQENARREAIKSAISAIMSRNMSHNLGSHYMYYTKAYLEQLANSIKDIAPDIRGAAKVLGYVQARMDYLATVISNDKYPYGAVNFKSQIYDELTIDDFSHRHFSAEEDKPKRITNFLLKNLIKSENFTRPDVRYDEELPNNSDQLFLHVKLLEEDRHYADFTGTWHSSKLKWVREKRKETPSLPTMMTEEKIKNQLSSLNIALPGGSMSCHALFNVVENFIRNSAKYLQNDANKSEGLICTLALKPNKDNKYIDIIIYDNKRNANKYIGKLFDFTKDFAKKLSKELEKVLDDNFTRDQKEFLNEIEIKIAEAQKIIEDQLTIKDFLGESNDTQITLKGYHQKIIDIEHQIINIFKSIINCFKNNTQVLLNYSELYKTLYPEAESLLDKWCQPSLFEQIVGKLSSLVIIDEQSRVSKENKGFKEMLFSSVWMRAYTFGSNMTYADVISDINNADNGERKLSLIEKHGFSVVKVRELNSNDILIYKRGYDFDGECNLGLQVTLPLFKQSDKFSLCGDKAIDVDRILNMMSDIVEVDKNFFDSADYHHVFTRPLLKESSEGMSIYDKYYKVVTDRFPNIDKYSLCLGKSEDNYNTTPQEFKIFFKRHMSTSGNADPREYEGYAYADTVSGGNFTITLLDLFNKGFENGKYKTDDDKLFSLKIKESALTRITVIDERLFNSTPTKEYPWLSLKNVRVLNYDDTFDESQTDGIQCGDGTVSSIFIGNKFRDGRDHTHFLTIHLGLIEKILKNSKYINNLISKELNKDSQNQNYNPLDPIRVKFFMKLLRIHYSEGLSRNIYIAIHSGRGNYSAELEGPLSKYPFISLSALENAFNNSKYQLSQLLYNTVYIGKGFANNI